MSQVAVSIAIPLSGPVGRRFSDGHCCSARLRCRHSAAGGTLILGATGTSISSAVLRDASRSEAGSNTGNWFFHRGCAFYDGCEAVHTSSILRFVRGMTVIQDNGTCDIAVPSSSLSSKQFTIEEVCAAERQSSNRTWRLQPCSTLVHPTLSSEDCTPLSIVEECIPRCCPESTAHLIGGEVLMTRLPHWRHFLLTRGAANQIIPTSRRTYVKLRHVRLLGFPGVFLLQVHCSSKYKRA